MINFDDGENQENVELAHSSRVDYSAFNYNSFPPYYHILLVLPSHILNSSGLFFVRCVFTRNTFVGERGIFHFLMGVIGISFSSGPRALGRSSTCMTEISESGINFPRNVFTPANRFCPCSTAGIMQFNLI